MGVAIKVLVNAENNNWLLSLAEEGQVEKTKRVFNKKREAVAAGRRIAKEIKSERPGANVDLMVWITTKHTFEMRKYDGCEY